MAGNVDEWVNDWYQFDYYSVSLPSNPPGPTNGTDKVLRGGYGGWGSLCYWLRTGARRAPDPDFRYHSIGFRCGVSQSP